MSNYATLKAAVQAVVKSNGNKEITGTNMQSTLLGMITSLASGYLFKGVATPSTSPGTPDENVFYIGATGTYTNFGTSTTVPVGSIGVFKYNGSWSHSFINTFEGIDNTPVANSLLPITSGAVYEGIGNVNDIYCDVKEDGTGYYLSDLTIGANANWRYKYIDDITPFAGKFVRFRAGDSRGANYTTYLCYMMLGDNSVVALRNSVYVYEENAGYALIYIPPTAQHLYLSWDKLGTNNIVPMLAVEPLEQRWHTTSGMFVNGVFSNDKRYMDCILAFNFESSDGLDTTHRYALSRFGFYSQYSRIYFAVYDVTAGTLIGTCTLNNIASVSGIKHYRFMLANGSALKGWADIIIDWDKYDETMQYIDVYNKVLLTYRGNADISFLLRKTECAEYYFDLTNDINEGKYYNGNIQTGVISLLSNAGFSCKEFDAERFKGKVLFIRNNIYGSISFVALCYVRLDDDSLQTLEDYKLLDTDEGAFVRIPFDASTLYLSWGSGILLAPDNGFIVCRDEMFDRIIDSFVERGYCTAVSEYRRCIVGISFDASPQSVYQYPISLLYFGINPDNMRLYIGFYDLRNRKRIGYYIFAKIYDSIPTSGIELFEMDTLSGHEDGALTLTNVKFIIDWSQYKDTMWLVDGYSNPFFIMQNNMTGKYITDIYHRMHELETLEDSFTINGDTCPVLPSQIFLRSDKEVPIYKNSLLYNPYKAGKIDINLLAEGGTGFERKIYEVQEPLYLSNDDMGGTGRFFLQRVSDMQHLYYKDVTVFHKDVSSVSGKTIKVMSLGDSLTQGRNWNDTPVTMLAEALAGCGVTLQYIGTLARNYTDNENNTVQIHYEGRGAWRYRTFVGMESKFAGLDVVIPSQTRSEWVEGVDGDMNTIKANNAWLYPATAQDFIDNPDFCFHFVSGSTVENKSYAEDAGLGDYLIFDPVRYFSERNIDIPDIVTIALGTNEWYITDYGGFNLQKATACAEFMFKQFRKVSSSMKIVVIPMNNFPVTRQSDWEQYFMPLCSNVMKVCDNLIEAGDDNLFVCPIYAQGSRWLAYNGTTGTASPVSQINDVQVIEMDNNVHMLYDKDDSNYDYLDSLMACVLNLID